MSRENVEVARRIWDHWSEGAATEDPAHLEAPWREGLLAPDSTFAPVQDLPGEHDGSYVGLEGMREFVRAWTREWTDWRIALEEVFDAGDDHVVAVVHQSAVGRTSGAPVDLRYGAVLTFRDGRVVDWRDHRDPADAFAAAGIAGAAG